jgi:multiple sugar transport system substrate-binding protein
VSFAEHDRKTFLVDACNDLTEGRLSRRAFLRKLATAGVGLSAFGSSWLGGGRPVGRLTDLGTDLAQAQDGDMIAWLNDVGRPYSGAKIRFASEATPPAIVVNQLVKDEFTKATGIKVEVEIVPLEQVFAKATQDVQGQLGAYDLYDLDQSWMANFAPDLVDPRAYYDENKALAMPGFDWDDIPKPLVDGIVTVEGKTCGVPFDIPIFILMYRKDLLEKHKLSVPKTMSEYVTAVRTLNDAEKGNGINGTTCQARSGHYSLQCDWAAFLWGNGGSVFNSDRKFVGNDEQGVKGLECYQELLKNAPPAATTWTWDGQRQSLTRGQAAMALSWGELFPGLDGNDSSVKGLFEAAPPPKEEPGRRPPTQAGFGEIPAIGHQGGSSLSLSRYSKNKEAAWLFLQWASSKDVMARVATLGGGASPIRTSSFNDPRVKAKAAVGPGTTRHFEAIKWTIDNAMGSEPDMAVWADISNNEIPVELGKLLTGEAYDGSAKACLDALAGMVDAKVKDAGLL